MGVGEVLVDPGLGLRLQLVLVELPGAYQHLAVAAVDDVAVDVDVGERVVEADLLYLLVGVQGRPRFPEAYVLESRLRWP